MSDAIPDGVVSVCKSVHTVVQYITFVVEGCQTEFRNLHGVQDVVDRTKCAKFACGDGVRIL